MDGTDPGAPAVMASLVDLLFVYLLRTWFAGHHDDPGWGRALFDPTVGTALSLIHTDPGRAWTLDTLARATRTPRATWRRALLARCLFRLQTHERASGHQPLVTPSCPGPAADGSAA
jgi:hypothetical protein